MPMFQVAFLSYRSTCGVTVEYVTILMYDVMSIDGMIEMCACIDFVFSFLTVEKLPHGVTSGNWMEILRL